MHVMADIRGYPQQILELLIEQNPHADQRELAFAFHEQVREDVSLRETLVNDVHNLLHLIVEKKKWGLWLYDGEEAICKLLDNKLEWEKEAADYGQQANGDRRNEVSQKTRIGELIEKVLAELCENKRLTKADWDAVAEWLKCVRYLYEFNQKGRGQAPVRVPLSDQEDEEGENSDVTPQVHTQPKPGSPPPPTKLGQQHAVFPLAEGEVSLSFPAELSVASAQMMASFVNLALKQAELQAKARESGKKDKAAN